MALFGGGKRLVGLDIGSTSVKAVELSVAGGGLIINGMGTAEIESPEAVGDAIQMALSESGIKAKHCVSSVSGRSVIFRQVSMVKMSDVDLRQAVEYEADKYIPFEVGEVQLDAQRMVDGTEDDDSGQMKVLLVAVKKALIEDHISLLQSIGLQPRIVDVDVFALGNAFELRNMSLGINDEEIRALVDIGASKTNINIMRGNKSYFHREIYVAGNDLTDAVAKRFGEDPKDVERMKKDPGGALESMQDAMLPVLEDIGNEIKLSFDYYENQYDQEVKEVFLSGGTVFFPGVDTMLGQIFNLPTKLWDPTEGLEITNFNPSGMGGTNSDMAIALGLASRLISKVGKVTTVAPSRPADAGTPVGGGVVTTQVPRTVGAASSTSYLKGVAFGAIASLGVAAALYFLNGYGYKNILVIAEGLFLGLPAGFGLWKGIQAMRPLPSRMGIVMSSLLIAGICCGGLFAARYTTNKPIVNRRARPAPVPTSVNLPKLPPKEQERLKKLAAKAKARKRSKPMDIEKITALVYIIAHAFVSGFCCILVANINLRKLEKEERTTAL